MTQRFILDENIVILAQKGENDRGERDVTCLRLFGEIIRICHTIVLDSNLWRAYVVQLDELTSGDAHASLRVLPVLANAFHTEGKIDLRANARSFP